MSEDLVHANSGYAASSERSPTKFQIGEVVYLNSGSPGLTVLAVGNPLDCIEGYPTVAVGWFDDLKFINMDFPEAALRRREKPSGEQPY